MALSANTKLSTKNTRGKALATGTIKTGAHIYKHAIVVVNAAGTLLPAANTTTTQFIGLALDEYTSGTVECFTNCWAEIPIKTAAATAGNVGAAAYAYDDANVTYDVTLGPMIGTIKAINTTTLKAWVALGEYPLSSAS